MWGRWSTSGSGGAPVAAQRRGRTTWRREETPAEWGSLPRRGRPGARGWRGTVTGVLVDVVLAIVGAGALWGMAGLRVVRQFERGVVLRFGRVHAEVRAPGLTRIHPGVDRFHRVNMQIVTMPVPAQDGITRDNVTVKVDAVVYFKVIDPCARSSMCRTTARPSAEPQHHTPLELPHDPQAGA